MTWKMEKLLGAPLVLAYGRLTDEELMEKVKKGSVEAYEVLYRRYEKPVWNFIRQKVRDKEMVMELSQEIFLKVFHQANRYDSSKSFRPWLWAMIRNYIIDELKKRDALSLSMKSEGIFEETYQEEEVSEDSLYNDPMLESLIDKASMEVLQRCFENLSDPQREALSLKLFSELSLKEIGEQMGIKLGAVKSLLFRAKSSLGDCLERGGVL